MSGLGPPLPRNWYLLGKSSALRSRAVAGHAVGERHLVVYRTAAGHPVAFAAHCAHMGCHLASATVVGDNLHCALHHRIIGPDGAFTGAPSGLRQPSFPATDFMGGLFIYLGAPDRLAPLSALGIEDNAVCYLGEHRFPIPWQWLVANGVDIEHLNAVHERKLLETPTLDHHGGELHLRYLTAPASPKIADRLTGWLARDGVHGSIRLVGGNMMLVESRVGKHEAFVLLSFVPEASGGTVIRGLVGVKTTPDFRARIGARIARLLFKAFLYKDLAVLENIEWRAPAQIDALGDDYMQRVCAYFRTLDHA